MPRSKQRKSRKYKKSSRSSQATVARRRARQRLHAEPVAHCPALLSPERQKDIRTRARANCRRAVTALQKAQDELLFFQNEDEPQYQAWFDAHCKQYVESIRQSQCKLWELQELVEKIHIEAQFNGLSMEEAYRRVTSPGYQSPFEQLDEDDGDPDFEFASEADEHQEFGDDDESQSTLREEARAFFDALFGHEFSSKEEADFAFEAFFEEIEFNASRGDSSFKDKFKSAREDYYFESSTPTANAKRCQDLYRMLARRLHPDTRTCTAVSADRWWYELQAAFEQSDLATLQQLWALVRLYDKEDERTIPIGDLQAARNGLKSETATVRHQIRKLKRNPSWGFSKLSKKDRSKMKQCARNETAQIKDEIDEAIDKLKFFLQFCKDASTFHKSHSEPNNHRQERSSTRERRKKVNRTSPYQEAFNF